jgi:hypothetical protein
MPRGFIWIHDVMPSESNAKCNDRCHGHAFCSRLIFVLLSLTGFECSNAGYSFRFLPLTVSLKRSLTVSCRNSTKLFFFLAVTT